MKKRQIAVGVIVVVAAGVVWVNRQLLFASPATPEQREFLPSLLADTSRIVIRSHPKLGGEVIGVVTSAVDISEFVTATELFRVESPCACFGFVSIDFIGADGSTNSLNYKSSIGETYVKFKSDWNIQGIPSKQFRRLVRKHSSQPEEKRAADE